MAQTEYQWRNSQQYYAAITGISQNKLRQLYLFDDLEFVFFIASKSYNARPWLYCWMVKHFFFHLSVKSKPT